jgi:RNA polymerase sigma-70 factor (TIGR02960 family)
MSLPAPDDVLGAARAGDRQAFDLLIRPHRRELLAHCYRMLGSIHDADDALQDTLLRAWRGLAGFAGRSSLRTWLYRIATNASITLAERKGRRELMAEDEDPPWLEPYPHDGDEDTSSPGAALERRESVEIAFVTAVQHLPPKERAVLLLREVLGFTAEETAEVLDVTVAAVTSRLQRARTRVRTRLPEQSQRDTLQRLGDRRLRALVTAYIDAWEAADADAIVALVTDDATFSMPPEALVIRGRPEIRRFIRKVPLQRPWRLVPTRAGGQLAFGNYTQEGSTWVAHSVDVVTLRGERISRITAFIEPSLLPILGLPERLDDSHTSGRRA